MRVANLNRSRGSGRFGEPGVRPARRPGPRGFAGVEGGSTALVDPPPEWRGTSVQMCGMWPFAAGSGSPMVGVPLGQHVDTGATVCGDPISWFRSARLISNPSMFVVGLPGLGKSTLISRVCIGLAGQGVTPLVLGDLRPDYVAVVRALGGQVVRIGRGLGGLNPLDPGGLSAVLPRLSGSARRELAAERHGRQLGVVSALVELVRRGRLEDHESAALAAAVQVLNDRPEVAVLADLVGVLGAGPEPVRSVLLDRGDEDSYRRLTDPLIRSLLALGSGAFGSVFAGHTSTVLDLDAPALCLDTSAIADTDERLTGAALLACWTAGFAAISGAQALADAGLGPQRIYFAVLDELWRALRAGEGMADRIDGITRLNRRLGLGYAMVTHTVADLQALPRAEDRAKAMGFIQRAGFVAMGGLPPSELELLSGTVDLSGAERRLVSSWSSPPAWDSVTGRESEPPGRGRFLVKIGGRPGIPLRVRLTEAERALGSSNARWGMDGPPVPGSAW